MFAQLKLKPLVSRTQKKNIVAVQVNLSKEQRKTWFWGLTKKKTKLVDVKQRFSEKKKQLRFFHVRYFQHPTSRKKLCLKKKRRKFGLLIHKKAI